MSDKLRNLLDQVRKEVEGKNPLEAMKDILETQIKMSKEKGFILEKKNDNKISQKTEILEEPCFCGSCLRFDNFEEVLTPFGGVFSRTAFNIGQKIFDVKFWTNGTIEHMTISPRDPISQERENLLKEKENILSALKTVDNRLEGLKTKSE